MHAQVVRAQIQPGKLDELISLFRDSVIPVARAQKGYRVAYMLVDSETNRAMTVSLWETEADLAAIASSGFYREQVNKAAALFAAPPEREVYEVVVES